MKTLLLVLAVTSIAAQGQVTPTTPTKFEKRGLGASNSGSSTISANGATVGAATPKSETVVRTTTYISLSPSRQWTSTEGKPVLGKLIAFEDVTTQEVKTVGTPATPAATPEMPKLPGKPTVVKDGKIRLLVGQRPFEVAIDKLSPLDRDFVHTIKHGVEGAK